MGLMESIVVAAVVALVEMAVRAVLARCWPALVSVTA